MNPFLSALGLKKKSIYDNFGVQLEIPYTQKHQISGYNQAIDDLESKLNTQEQMVEELAKYLFILDGGHYWEDTNQDKYRESARLIISQSQTWLMRKDV